ncbi:D-alanyl-D-alanine carboxypeptidase family protein [Sulfoacidibacillus thermotolerans]|uniref:serine-type D-Ala-D-Ala carboxypeptidase n=1 Tax=Sulfoacidibacillus thermotolerans TaxID=1765684 RepID=A0A2U3D5R8_SULT2|nr:D-alanyl-D-alanine carboxypeptidase family protein [Sulfoacidibacillus thermotolerans]PWI56612.1 hypothetical protein BM613_12805 [Sulfoacidibacillus thermotolerans]
MDKIVHIVQKTRKKPLWRSVQFTIATLLLVNFASPLHVVAKVTTTKIPAVISQEPENSAEAACLIDVNTGRILYEKNAHKRMRIASLTKIITAWIAVRSGKLDQMVTVSANAVRQEGSSVYLAYGERQTLRNLTYAMMLRSGNDSAMAIAEFLGGSNDRFAKMMNIQVQKLGLHESHFMNPHGLDHKDHYSTAHDMAVITATALRNPVFKTIVKTKYYSIPWEGQKWDRKMKNKNKLLWMMPNADGVKTGFTKLSGRCLASSASSEGRQVAFIVLRDGNDWVDSQRLLTYGLTAFEVRDVVKLAPLHAVTKVQYGVEQTVPLQPMGHVNYVFGKNEDVHVKTRIVQLKRLSAPVKRGTIAGRVQYWFQGKEIGEVNLITTREVKPKGILGRIRDLFL